MLSVCVQVYTGAGISTAADIPDYRGPRGVWTRLRRGETVTRVDAARATPTFTHMALAALWARGTLKFLVSQNCDGLHVRAGTPRRALAELHGDMFAERCAACRAVYLRAFDTTERTARHRHGTRRLCHACGAELHDTIVHFGERGRAAWPLNWAGALRHAARADVVLCLGSSLKVLRRYPRLWRMRSPPHARPRLYIVNLQWTPKDSVAALKINARCDDVMRALARRLRLRVPRYRAARDPLLAHAEPLAPPEAHTTRRPRLPPPPRHLPPLDHEDLGSPSASDSDEELPLRRLADRLRRDDSPPLRAFRVTLHGGEATLLLRPEHAPDESAPSPARRLTSELRRVRLPPRCPAVESPVALLNGCIPPLDYSEHNGRLGPRNGSAECDSKLRRLLERAPDLDLERVHELKPKLEPKPDLDLKPELKLEPKMEALQTDAVDSWSEGETGASSGSEDGAGSLAAAIIARAVLLCRGSLYPGLHTILAPVPRPVPRPPLPVVTATAPVACAWCSRVYGARRCLWYGAARLTPVEARAWRRVRARRYLCACCGEGAVPGGEEDTGGWYGKGYRKGRRRRR